MSDKSMVSVIVIVYNQFDSVMKTLKGFSLQTLPKESYEVILIDDGSDDELASFEAEQLPGLNNLRVFHTKNQGRAAGRNYGVRKANGDILVFCDGDRVPCADYLEEYKKDIEAGYDVIVGASYDYFGKVAEFDAEKINWKTIGKFSRLPSYYKRIMKIYDSNEETHSNLAWLSLLVGNACIRKNKMIEAGGFDESFKGWGFEHFELGYRLCEHEAVYKTNPRAQNFHIPHPRENNFYRERILENIRFIKSLHNNIDTEILQGLLIEGKKIEELKNI